MSDIYKEFQKYQTLILTPEQYISDSSSVESKTFFNTQIRTFIDYEKDIMSIRDDTKIIRNKQIKTNYMTHIKPFLDKCSNKNNLLFINVRGDGLCFYNCAMLYLLRYCNLTFNHAKVVEFMGKFKNHLI